MSSKSTLQVTVVGGGVIGVTTATRLIQELRGGARVTLISDHFTPETTGDGAAGLWGPYLLGDQGDPEIAKRWCRETHDYFQEIYYSQDANRMGVSQSSGCRISKEKQEEPPMWKDVVHGYSPLTSEELRKYGPNYQQGAWFTTYTAECPRLLPSLLRIFVANGGKIRRQRVKTLRELIGTCDVLINCTGVEAYHVTPDPSVYPVRGQVMRVKAPWVKNFLLDESSDGNYIIPNTNSVVLGGTHQEGDWNLKVDSKDSDDIWRGCCRLLPSLQEARIESSWVGLRPGRFSVRLEHEVMSDGYEKVDVIHNYGHGGSGITLCWGCAGDAVQLVKEQIRRHGNVGSKL